MLCAFVFVLNAGFAVLGVLSYALCLQNTDVIKWERILVVVFGVSSYTTMCYTSSVLLSVNMKTFFFFKVTLKNVFRRGLRPSDLTLDNDVCTCISDTGPLLRV